MIEESPPANALPLRQALSLVPDPAARVGWKSPTGVTRAAEADLRLVVRSALQRQSDRRAQRSQSRRSRTNSPMSKSQ